VGRYLGSALYRKLFVAEHSNEGVIEGTQRRKALYGRACGGTNALHHQQLLW